MGIHATLSFGGFDMTTFLPKEVAAGLEAARKTALRKKSRLRVHAGEQILTVLRYWETGFSVDMDDAPQLRGLVDLYDGSRHLYQCLIVASEEDGDQMRYEFKRNTRAAKRPALDFEKRSDAPAGLIARL